MQQKKVQMQQIKIEKQDRLDQEVTHHKAPFSNS